jgi:hypothetical protein
MFLLPKGHHFVKKKILKGIIATKFLINIFSGHSNDAQLLKFEKVNVYILNINYNVYIQYVEGF